MIARRATKDAAGARTDAAGTSRHAICAGSERGSECRPTYQRLGPCRGRAEGQPRGPDDSGPDAGLARPHGRAAASNGTLRVPRHRGGRTAGLPHAVPCLQKGRRRFEAPRIPVAAIPLVHARPHQATKQGFSANAIAHAAQAAPPVVRSATSPPCPDECERGLDSTKGQAWPDPCQR